MDINASLEQKVPNRTPSLSISYKLDFCNAQDQITTQNNTQFLKKKRFNNDNYFKTIHIKYLIQIIILLFISCSEY